MFIICPDAGNSGVYGRARAALYSPEGKRFRGLFCGSRRNDGQFGQLVKNVDADTANQVLDFVRDKLDSGALDSQEGLKDALQEGKEQFGVEISEADAQKIVDTVDQLEQFGFSPDTVIDEAKSLYEKYGEDCVDHVNEAVTNAVKAAAANAAESFADYLKESVTDTLQGIFKQE